VTARVTALSRYVRTYRADGVRMIEAVVNERSAPLDDVMLRVVRALEAAPRTRDELLDDAALGPRAQIERRLVTLDALGLLVSDGVDETARMFDAFEADVRAVPIVDQIELTNICPMKCVMCPKGLGLVTRPQGYASLALVQKIVDEIAAAGGQRKPVTLHNLGESALVPHLEDAVRIVARAGLQSEVSINPGYLPLEKYRALAAAGLSRLVLPVDGIDVVTLEKIRGAPVKAAQAFTHLAQLFEHVRAHPDEPGPQILVQMIRMKANAHQLDAFLERYGGLGLPRVSAFVKELDANTRDATSLLAARARPYLCRAPWLSVVVLWDGRVVPCCYDDNAAHVLGDASTSSLAAIWADEPARRLRADLRGGAAPRLCEGCAHRPDTWERPSLDDEPAMESLHW
jgi:MoaA/NifB/PqqE/SkfB family radical SAM enzyme